uniref:CCZ1/INTU/HSP4 first Longin domain-containing protein n=1 Tax=Ornithorhynchus anatinus TaxID=9258 RepID=A0A6I8PBX8_ORNAN
PACTAPPRAWRYFFLYDGSKVKEEGDPTRAGICYFYPAETDPDRQELLCGQIAGVARCLSEFSGSPPTLLRLRRLKFALEGDGDFLWALGCAAELPDVSCQRLLHHLVGFFRFYNGPVSLAYKNRAWGELGRKWDVYIRHIQNTTGDAHRIFQALGNLDKTQVEPLLLLKGALILQTCQRCPHVLAGCILYRGLIVSTQDGARTWAWGLAGHAVEADGSGFGSAVLGPGLPPDVRIVPVFLTRDEADALRAFPPERRRRSSPAPQADGGDDSPPAPPSPEPGGPRGTEVGRPPSPDPGPPPEDPGASAEAGRGRGAGAPSAGAPRDRDVGRRPETPESPGRRPEGDPGGHFPASPAPGRLPRSPGGERAGSEAGDPPAPLPPEGEGPPTPTPPAEAGRPRGPGSDAEGAAGGAALVKMSLYVHRVRGLVLTLLAERPLRADGAAAEEVVSGPGPAAGGRPGLSRGVPSVSPPLKYYSSLASLNGLEVHLRETWPRAQPFPARAAYSFAHHDRVRNVLTANLPRGPTAQDRHFLRAAGLAHADFARLPTLYEVTLRNASATVYACRNADGLCALSAKAKQKMMRHGVNLL